ncbi:hypothetical protein [Spirulina sp. 06S082]|nr:hypothetical protein [Spirulina sp. 06S082]MEA5469278.1 hypothetical protein [Spirulina sp. 06S082]
MSIVFWELHQFFTDIFILPIESLYFLVIADRASVYSSAIATQ